MGESKSCCGSKAFIITILCINTILVGALWAKVGCPLAGSKGKSSCAMHQQMDGKICPITGKVMSGMEVPAVK